MLGRILLARMLPVSVVLFVLLNKALPRTDVPLRFFQCLAHSLFRRGSSKKKHAPAMLT